MPEGITENRALVVPANSSLPADHDLIGLYLTRFDRASTRREYEKDLVDFFGKQHIQLTEASSVSFVSVNSYLQSLQDRGLKPATIQRRISCIRGFFSWLVALGTLESNPADKHVVRRIRRVKREDHLITVLTRDQARRLVEATAGNGEAAVRDRALVVTLLYGALRRSEAASMNVEHVRSAGPYWVIDLPDTKGGTDQYVKIPPQVVEAVEAVKAEYGIATGAIWRSLSNNSRGRRLSARSIYTIVNQTAERAGIRSEVGAHTLRHTACTLAIEGGANPQQVQAHARHKNLETTMIYVHQRDKLRDNASDYINL